MTLMCAPVRASKSGARRMSGSATCGPLKVSRLTLMPANGFSSWAVAGAATASISVAPATIAATRLDRALFMPSSSLSVVGRVANRMLPNAPTAADATGPYAAPIIRWCLWWIPPTARCPRRGYDH
jgi:hypothetical protein